MHATGTEHSLFIEAFIDVIQNHLDDKIVDHMLNFIPVLFQHIGRRTIPGLLFTHKHQCTALTAIVVFINCAKHEIS